MRALLAHYRLPNVQDAATIPLIAAQLDGINESLQLGRVRIKAWAARLEDGLVAQRKERTLQARQVADVKTADERDAWVDVQVKASRADVVRANNWLSLYDAACKIIEKRCSLLALQASGVRSGATLGGV
jgi:hypothetical protein